MTGTTRDLSFFHEQSFESDKDKVKNGVEQYQDSGHLTGVTARELYNKIGFDGWISTLRARLRDLEQEGHVEVADKRECTDSDHEKEVYAYRVAD